MAYLNANADVYEVRRLWSSPPDLHESDDDDEGDLEDLDDTGVQAPENKGSSETSALQFRRVVTDMIVSGGLYYNCFISQPT